MSCASIAVRTSLFVFALLANIISSHYRFFFFLSSFVGIYLRRRLCMELPSVVPAQARLGACAYAEGAVPVRRCGK